VSKRKIGVYICHCGGNISDYVDVEQVRQALSLEDDVEVAATTLFTCSDSSQQQMVKDIQDKGLDGLVVASCSPKLHLFTFRGVAERAGLNPYQYVQVNVREQCSWTHRDNMPEATDKAVRLVRAGVAKAGLTRPLDPIRVDTVPSVLVVGAGVAGLRASLALADLGLAVHLIEREAEPGGWVNKLDALYPRGRDGAELVAELVERVRNSDNVALYTNARLLSKAGSVGNFDVQIAVADETIPLNVGAIVVATGFESYEPAAGEYGRGLDGVVTLPEFRALLRECEGGELTHNGSPVGSVAYVYCVGSRQPDGFSGCSRYCCSAAVHAASLASERFPELEQFHLHKDMRTYGKYELLYEASCRSGSAFLKFDEHKPPTVQAGDDTRLVVRSDDLLSDRRALELPVDLVVLVTGQRPRSDDEIGDLLKIPLGQEGFFNEIHLKLRPVETVIDGVFLAGACQGPKSAGEAVTSALSAVSKVAAMLMKGYVELSPLVARIDADKCTWCEKCFEACPYGAIDRQSYQGREIASVHASLCKGGGGCLPVCPHNAIDLEGYTDAQMESMIDSLAAEVAR